MTEQFDKDMKKCFPMPEPSIFNIGTLENAVRIFDESQSPPIGTPPAPLHTISPLYMSDEQLSYFPPTMVTVGDKDIQFEEIMIFSERLMHAQAKATSSEGKLASDGTGRSGTISDGKGSTPHSKISSQLIVAPGEIHIYQLFTQYPAAVIVPEFIFNLVHHARADRRKQLRRECALQSKYLVDEDITNSKSKNPSDKDYQERDDKSRQKRREVEVTLGAAEVAATSKAAIHSLAGNESFTQIAAFIVACNE
jgi:hypothetical protein